MSFVGCFRIVVLEKTLENPFDCKEINPEYSLEGLMLRLKLQYFGHLMWRADSLENTLMLGKIACKRRRGQQRIGWLDRLNEHVSESHLVVSDSATPWTYTVHGILQANILEWVAFPFSRRSSLPRDRTQVSHVAEGFFTSWATRKAKNTVLSSLSLLQWIFQTQESNWGLLHCRWILYQLSNQDGPDTPIHDRREKT